MTSDYDAIVVGARCAGSPTAMLLARRGYRVLVVDRASFPSDTLSTHYIHQPGVASLHRWGLLQTVAASNCPPIRHQMIDAGPIVLRGALDDVLVRAAAEAGAEVWPRFTVEASWATGSR